MFQLRGAPGPETGGVAGIVVGGLLRTAEGDAAPALIAGKTPTTTDATKLPAPDLY